MSPELNTRLSSLNDEMKRLCANTLEHCLEDDTFEEATISDLRLNFQIINRDINNLMRLHSQYVATVSENWS